MRIMVHWGLLGAPHLWNPPYHGLEVPFVQVGPSSHPEGSETHPQHDPCVIFLTSLARTVKYHQHGAGNHCNSKGCGLYKPTGTC